jgi:hypothetical protein
MIHDLDSPLPVVPWWGESKDCPNYSQVAPQNRVEWREIVHEGRPGATVGVAEENPVRQPRNGRLVVSEGRELSVGGIMDRAYTGGSIGGGDAMVPCRSTLGLPISSEDNF